MGNSSVTPFRRSILLLALVLTGCAQAASIPTLTPVPDTATLVPTDTAELTATWTIAPTDTSTVAPTATPTPQNTATPEATATPEVKEFGGGDVLGYCYGISIGKESYLTLDQLPKALRDAIGDLTPTSKEDLKTVPRMLTSDGTTEVDWTDSFVMETTKTRRAVLPVLVRTVSEGIPNPGTKGGTLYFFTFEIFRDEGSFFLISVINSDNTNNDYNYITRYDRGIDPLWFTQETPIVREQLDEAHSYTWEGFEEAAFADQVRA